MGHPQPPTPVVPDNLSANGIVSGMAKQKRYRAIYMRFYWVCNRFRKNNFHIFCKEENKNLEDYFTKHHPIWHHINM